MDHQIAVQNQAAERYLLGMMLEEEREAFEEHYFSCQICADDVRELSAFIENVRAVVSSPLPPRPVTPPASIAAGPAAWWKLFWRSPMLLGAVSTAFLVMLAIDRSTIHDLRAARAIPPVILKPEVRDRLQSIPAGRPLSLLFSVEGIAAGQPVSIDIRSGEGVTLYSVPAVSPGDGNALTLQVPEPKLAPGRYEVVVGRSKYPFQVVNPN